MKNKSDNPFRALQEHLDRLPVGFPASATGADIRLLKHIFTPAQARLAACLSHEPRTLDRIFEDAGHLVETREALAEELMAMVRNGGIEVRQIKGKQHFANVPLVVGMYELQVNRLSPEFIRDFKTYTSEKSFGISFLSTPVPQMRTIPIQKSISLDQAIDPVEDVEVLLKTAQPPFVILPCICRKKKSLQGRVCQQTLREETCLAMGNVGQTLTAMGLGRQISRQEASDILQMNQNQGLVLQAANTRIVEFICSCCGCCCSMLGLHKDLPLPLDFWATGFRAAMEKDKCLGCGKCLDLCQTGALTQAGEKNKGAALNQTRCIGCGLCVPSCPAGALTLLPAGQPRKLPADRDALYRELTGSKGPGSKGTGSKMGAKIRTVAKLARGMALTGDFRLLKSRPDPD